MNTADFHPEAKKKGNLSVTKGMLAERDAEMDAEQASGGHALWRDIRMLC